MRSSMSLGAGEVMEDLSAFIAATPEEHSHQVADPETIFQEREILLKAALQMLDEDECRYHGSVAPGSGGDGFGGSSSHLMREGSSRMVGDQHASGTGGSDVPKSVLKRGILKKASGGKLSQTWKLKYVEVSHGLFVYEDDQASWNEVVNRRKAISLVADRCRCKALKLRSESFGNCVFEVTEFCGIRRLWMAPSVEERDAWINTINAAIIGSAGDFEGEDSSEVFMPHWAATAPPPTPQSTRSSRPFSLGKGNSTTDFVRAPYAQVIGVYSRTRDAVYSAKSAEAYRDVLSILSATPGPLEVPASIGKMPAGPVSVVDSIKGGVGAVTGVGGNNSRRNPKPVALTMSLQTSQVWKDMCRDVIMINRKPYSGLDAIICALVRTIVKASEDIRVLQNQRHVEREKSSVLMKPQNPLDVVMNTLRRRSSGRDEAAIHNSAHWSSSFHLNEANALACAKEILLSCNRTQSGGDTYDVVNTMLCHHDFAVLTPSATEAEPMEIILEIIQRESSTAVVHNAWLQKPGYATKASTDSMDNSTSSKKSNMSSPFSGMSLASPFSNKKDRVPFWDSNSHINTGSNNNNDINNAPASRPTSETRVSPIPAASPQKEPPAAGDNIGIAPSKSFDAKDENMTGAPVGDATPHDATTENRVARTPSGSILKAESSDEWQNSTSPMPDFSESLGMAQGDDETKPQGGGARGTHLPPLTINNFYRNTMSSVNTDDSSLASTTASGSGSLSSTEAGGGISWASYVLGGGFFTSSSSVSNQRSSDDFSTSIARGSSDDEDHEAGPKRRFWQWSRPGSNNALKAERSNNTVDTTDHSKNTSSISSGSMTAPGAPAAGAHGSAEAAAAAALMRSDDANSPSESDAASGQHGTSRGATTSESDDASRHAAAAGALQGPRNVSDRPMCIRVEVRARSSYKICSQDPQGDGNDTWATVSGTFRQIFYIKSCCNGKPSVSDRIVSIDLEPTGREGNYV